MTLPCSSRGDPAGFKDRGTPLFLIVPPRWPGSTSWLSLPARRAARSPTWSSSTAWHRSGRRRWRLLRRDPARPLDGVVHHRVGRAHQRPSPSAHRACGDAGHRRVAVDAGHRRGTRPVDAPPRAAAKPFADELTPGDQPRCHRLRRVPPRCLVSPTTNRDGRRRPSTICRWPTAPPPAKGSSPCRRRSPRWGAVIGGGVGPAACAHRAVLRR